MYFFSSLIYVCPSSFVLITASIGALYSKSEESDVKRPTFATRAYGRHTKLRLCTMNTYVRYLCGMTGHKISRHPLFTVRVCIIRIHTRWIRCSIHGTMIYRTPKKVFIISCSCFFFASSSGAFLCAFGFSDLEAGDLRFIAAFLAYAYYYHGLNNIILNINFSLCSCFSGDIIPL